MKKVLVLTFVIMSLFGCTNKAHEKEIEKIHAVLIEKHDVVMPVSMQLPKLKGDIMTMVQGLSHEDTLFLLASQNARDLTKANEDMYSWMDKFSEAMNQEDQEVKFQKYKELELEIAVIDSTTKVVLKNAKDFLNEK